MRPGGALTLALSQRERELTHGSRFLRFRPVPVEKEDKPKQLVLPYFFSLSKLKRESAQSS